MKPEKQQFIQRQYSYNDYRNMSEVYASIDNKTIAIKIEMAKIGLWFLMCLDVSLF